MRKRTALFLVLVLLFCFGTTVSASDVGSSYLYSKTNEGIMDVYAPQAYLPQTVYDADTLSVELKQPEDLILSGDGGFYLCDTGANAIYQFDASFRLLRTIKTFENGQKTDSLNQPTGVCENSEGNLFIADGGNQRVVVLNKEGELVNIIDNPQADSNILSQDFVFVPQKLAVDDSNRLFVLCKDVFEGILQFSEAGSFIGYIGSNAVVPNAIEVLWKRIMSKEQKSKIADFIPVEYTNISLDYQSFLYAVTSVKNVDSPIRRLNPSGNDVLVRNPINGTEEVVGDELYVSYSNLSSVTTGPSSFVDITSDNYGNYYALDGKRGRIFAYDVDGNLLYAFGALGTGQKGALESPSAILYHQDYLYVVDRTLCQVIRFEPTDYALLIRSAMEAYYQQEYEQSVDLWQQVLTKNSYFDLAYAKAGWGLYRLGRYDEAMESFKAANIKSGYSKAYEQYSAAWLDEHFTAVALTVIGGVILLVIAIVLIYRYRRRKRQHSAG